MTERASRLRSRAGVGPPDDDPLDPDVVPALAHRALVRGDQRSAFDLLLDAIRQGGWRHGWLWSELADAAAEPDDYGAVRELWLHSPPACHHDVPILDGVARAAAIADEHTDARSLLRAALLRARARGGAFAAAPASGGATAADGGADAALTAVESALAAVDVRPFLVGATLLHALRDGRLPPPPGDLDLGILAADVDGTDVTGALRDAGLAVRPLDLVTDRLRVDASDGVQIRLWPHDTDGARTWRTDPIMRRWTTTFSVERQPLPGGQERFVPAPTATYLEDTYGRWQRPDPSFDALLDGTNVEIVDDARAHTALLVRLLRQVIDGHDDRVARYRRALRDRGEGAWLDRL